jgi:uncharacterized protein YdhG (YjbR/CyaY superfamily)
VSTTKKKVRDSRIKKFYSSPPSTHRATLLEMRRRILKVVPKAEEVVSYGMPAFKVDGVIVAGLMAHKNHIGYYPFSGSVLKNFKRDIADLSHTKSALHIPLEKPLSQSLVRKLIRARISDCAVSKGQVNRHKYHAKDGYWRSLKIAAPARRGLIDKKIHTLRDLSKIAESEFFAIHGIGQNAAKVIKKEMRNKKVRFKTA